MNIFKTSLSTLTIASTLIIAGQAEAKPSYPGLQPSSYNNAIGCTSCHSSGGASATEHNVTQPYGRLFARYSDDDNGGSIAGAYRAAEPLDSDGDGFSNLQEIMFGYGFNGEATPALTGTGATTSGTVSAQPALNETIASLSQVATTPLGIALTAGQKNLGGTVDIGITNLTASATGSTGTPTLLFSTGGVQALAKVYFVDASNAATLLPATAATINANGTVSISITDEGPYDLYTTANFIADIKVARTPGISSYATVSPYATVSSLAVISDYATINAYATVGDYALVDTYATVGDIYATPTAHAVVDAYATVAANTVLDSYATIAMPSTFAGSIKTRVAVITTAPNVPQGIPTTPASAGGGGGAVAPQAGLHCMTNGLGSLGIMFVSLFTLGLFVRRKQK